MSVVNLSWVPSVNRKVVIAGFVLEVWVFIALLVATGLDMVSYGEVRYLNWILPLTMPIWILLMSNSTPRELSSGDEKRAIMAIAVTFTIFVITVLAGLLKDHV